MTKQHKTIKEWQETLRGRVSPRLANQEMFDMLWEDLPHIFAEFAKLETERESTAKEIERLDGGQKELLAKLINEQAKCADQMDRADAAEKALEGLRQDHKIREERLLTAEKKLEAVRWAMILTKDPPGVVANQLFKKADAYDKIWDVLNGKGE